MAIDYLAQKPFAALSLIGAPAILTNASSVLALSTSNRFLRAGERIRALSAQLQDLEPGEEHTLLSVQVDRVERQAILLLTALRGAYVALASFAAASLISIVGAGLVTTNFQLASNLTWDWPWLSGSSEQAAWSRRARTFSERHVCRCEISRKRPR